MDYGLDCYERRIRAAKAEVAGYKYALGELPADSEKRIEVKRQLAGAELNLSRLLLEFERIQGNSAATHADSRAHLPLSIR